MPALCNGRAPIRISSISNASRPRSESNKGASDSTADLSRAVKDTTEYVADAGESFSHGLKVPAGSRSSHYHSHSREDTKGKSINTEDWAHKSSSGQGQARDTMEALRETKP